MEACTQDGFSCAAAHFGCRQAEEWKVVAGKGAKVRIAIDVKALRKKRSEGDKIDAEASGKVYEKRGKPTPTLPKGGGRWG